LGGAARAALTNLPPLQTAAKSDHRAAVANWTNTIINLLLDPRRGGPLMIAMIRVTSISRATGPQARLCDNRPM
jgi:hypothetical protein